MIKRCDMPSTICYYFDGIDTAQLNRPLPVLVPNHGSLLPFIPRQL